MKRFISILLLIGFLSSTTELHEFFKLPHLVHHFFEHRSELTDISLAQFLQIHYSKGDNKHKNENHDDGCLPFQGNHPIQQLHFYANNQMDFKLIPLSNFIKDLYSNQFSVSSTYFANIWQPPKIG